MKGLQDGVWGSGQPLIMLNISKYRNAEVIKSWECVITSITKMEIRGAEVPAGG